MPKTGNYGRPNSRGTKKIIKGMRKSGHKGSGKAGKTLNAASARASKSNDFYDRNPWLGKRKK